MRAFESRSYTALACVLSNMAAMLFYRSACLVMYVCMLNACSRLSCLSCTRISPSVSLAVCSPYSVSHLHFLNKGFPPRSPQNITVSIGTVLQMSFTIKLYLNALAWLLLKMWNKSNIIDNFMLSWRTMVDVRGSSRRHFCIISQPGGPVNCRLTLMVQLLISQLYYVM